MLFLWQAAFIYIIGIEGFIHYEEILSRYGSNANVAARYIVLTFLLSVSAYLIMYLAFGNRLKSFSNQRQMIMYRTSAVTFMVIMLAYLFFLSYNLEGAYNAFLGGRKAAGRGFGGELNFLFNAMSNAISMTLPAFLSYLLKYLSRIKRYALYSFLISFPIFFVLFLLGTRLTLLFSVLGVLVVILAGRRIRPKTVIILLLIGILGLALADTMVKSRGTGLVRYTSGFEYFESGEFLSTLYTREGVTGATTMLVDYFENNQHLFGVQSAFAFIFWIPRSVWPSKPSMLGYWLIREVQSIRYGSSHSISFGFAGDAYADFGFFGGVLFALFFGCVLAILELKVVSSLSDSFAVLYAAVLYPFVFLSMRSLQTSLFSLIGSILFLLAVKKTMVFKPQNEKREGSAVDNHRNTDSSVLRLGKKGTSYY
jgi:oligosaccharide repeat unit polymerase